MHASGVHATVAGVLLGSPFRWCDAPEVQGPVAEHLEHRFAPCQREVGELAYGVGTDLDNHVKIGVLLGSGTAALLAAVILRIRDRHYRTVNVQESVAEDRDGGAR